jgi:hypothetical protein
MEGLDLPDWNEALRMEQDAGFDCSPVKQPLAQVGQPGAAGTHTQTAHLLLAPARTWAPLADGTAPVLVHRRSPSKMAIPSA